jgi:histidyl-tRNA synthetase
LGGKPTVAVGFGAGIERLCLLLEACDAVPDDLVAAPHVFLVAAGASAEATALVLAEQLRDALPALRLVLNAGGGSFKSQFKKADKSGAALAVIIGEEEAQARRANVKWLRDETREQQSVELDGLAAFLAQAITPGVSD